MFPINIKRFTSIRERIIHYFNKCNCSVLAVIINAQNSMNRRLFEVIYTVRSAPHSTCVPQKGRCVFVTHILFIKLVWQQGSISVEHWSPGWKQRQYTKMANENYFKLCRFLIDTPEEVLLPALKVSAQFLR